MSAASPLIVTLTDPHSPAAEAYRSLRTNVQFASLEPPVRTILVTSAGPDEGKSVTAANLAVILAQADQRVVLVDADLRRPVQHDLFGVQSQPGLSTMLLAAAAEPAPLQGTTVPQLSVLPSGPLPPNPAELLASPRLRAALAALREEADYVVIDSPPVAVVTDAAVLATQVDGVLLALSVGKVKRDVAAQAKTLLESVHATILGVVLHNVPFNPRDFQEYFPATA